MKPAFDPNDPQALEAALADLASDEVALSPAFRDQLQQDAARVLAPAPARPFARFMEWVGFAGLPVAALAGAWLGIMNPSFVLQSTPWDTSSTLDQLEEDTLFEDVFGSGWVSLEDTE
jgi:hypothetical protein